MDQIVTPQEAMIESLLQVIAVLLDKMGGEVIVSRREFEMLEDISVVGRHISKDYVVLRLAEEDEESGIVIGFENPQPI